MSIIIPTFRHQCSVFLACFLVFDVISEAIEWKPPLRTYCDSASLFLSPLQRHPETLFMWTVFYIKFMITKDYLKKSQSIFLCFGSICGRGWICLKVKDR